MIRGIMGNMEMENSLVSPRPVFTSQNFAQPLLSSLFLLERLYKYPGEIRYNGSAKFGG